MKKFLSLVLALVMTMSLVTVGAGAKDFDDNDSIDYDVAVAVMSECGVIDGYSDGSFKPNATLTRGAAAKIICNMILGPTTAGALVADAAPFKDVPANSTFAGYIAYCSKEGIISGYADGTFRPGNTLTGYAFMKMLLGALGYDKTAEGYDGANWSINVAKRALGIGLDDGLSADFNGIKPVTREEACLYAFNTLQADLVKYDNQSSITVGDIVISTNSKAEPDDARSTDKANNIKTELGTAVPQFGERYFTKLVATPSRDKLGRPITEWKYDKGDAINEVKTADAVYSAKPKYKEVYSDLGLAASTSFNYYFDGVQQATCAIAKSDSDVAIPGLGDGVNVEVFNDKDTPANNTISVYYTYAGKVTKIGTNSDDKREATVTIYNKWFGGYAASTTLKFESETLAKNDIVQVNVGDDAGTAKIVDAQAVEKLTGTVTKKVGSDTFYIDGTKYKANAVAKLDTNVRASDEVEYYLDSNGYILKMDAADSSAVEDLAFVVDTSTSRGVRWAKLYLTDGTKKTVDLDDDEPSTAFKPGDIVKFKTNKSGLVEHQALDNYHYYSSASNGYYLTKGVTEVKYNGSQSTGIKMNGKTTIMVIEGNDITMYTGVANIPALQATDIAVSWKNGDTKDKPAQLVVVIAKAGTVENSNAKLKLFGIKKNEDTVYVDGVSNFIEVLDIKTGENVAVKAGIGYNTAANNIYVAKTYGVNGDGQISSLTPADDGKFYYTTVGTVKVDGDTITMDSAYSLDDVTPIVGGVSKYINSDVAVYVVNKKLDEVVDTWTLDNLEDFDETIGTANDYQYVLFTEDNDHYVDAIVLVKSK